MKVAYLGNGNETTDAFSGVMEYLGKGNETPNTFSGVMEYLDKGNETTDESVWSNGVFGQRKRNNR